MKSFIVTLFLFIGINSFSASITGIVKDIDNKELLAGASIFVKNNPELGTLSGLDGTFSLKEVPPGEITLVCKSSGYNVFEKKLTVPTHGISNYTIALNSGGLELKAIEVVAISRSNDFSARKLEKLSPNILNIVSANSIEASPDLDVASVLQRVSGVTLDNTSGSGNAQYAIMRGMDKRYNITLVNGVKIASPNDNQRYVPLNLFPSELLDRLEVSKTRTAETEGDATGGAINMVMKDAPSHFSVNMNAALGYNSYYFNRQFTTYDRDAIVEVTPYEKYGKDYVASVSDFKQKLPSIKRITPHPNATLGFSVGNRFLDGRLGFLFAGNYQDSHQPKEQVLLGDEMIQTEKNVRLTNINYRTYNQHEIKKGLHSKIDFKFDSNHKLELYTVYFYNDATQVRQTNSTNFKLFYEPEKGNQDLSYQTRLLSNRQQIFASTLFGHHRFFKHLFVNWTMAFSDARQNRPDRTYLKLDNLRQNFTDDIYFDGDGSNRIWEHNNDRDVTGTLNLTYHIKSEFGKFILQSGGLIKDKKRENVNVGYRIKFPNAGKISTPEYYDIVNKVDWVLDTPKGIINESYYDAGESTGAGYAQIKWEHKKFETIVGLRTEYTKLSYHMHSQNLVVPQDGIKTYYDFLPNINLKYAYNKKSNIRLSYYRSINRQGFFEIVPYEKDSEEGYSEYGNPKLKHAVIDNADARWEFFPKATEQILFGVFYKHLQDPIEMAYTTVNNRQYGYKPENLGNARNFGAEVDLIKYFREFGVKANYTYTHSAISTQKMMYAKDQNDNYYIDTKEQVRPLVGQAAHVANLSLLYKNVNHGWDAQLALSYIGDRIAIVSNYYNSDYWQKGNVQLDVSAEKKFKSGVSVFLKANNLITSPIIRYVNTRNSYNDKFPFQSGNKETTIVRRDNIFPSFLAGIRYKLR